MTPESTLGGRMERIFAAEDVPAVAVERPEPDPSIPAEVVEPIRELLREGDWPSAAAAARMVLDSVGIEVRASEEGVRSGSGTGNPAGMRTADASSAGKS